MAMNFPADPLACGRDLETLYEHVSAGTLDDHEQSCPHCRRAATDPAPVRRTAVLATAAGDVPGVRVRRCRFPDPADTARVLINLSLRYGTPAAAAADDVRRAVRTAAHAQLGLDLRTIDIEVEDVHAP